MIGREIATSAICKRFDNIHRTLAALGNNALFPSRSYCGWRAHLQDPHTLLAMFYLNRIQRISARCRQPSLPTSLPLLRVSCLSGACAQPCLVTGTYTPGQNAVEPCRHGATITRATTSNPARSPGQERYPHDEILSILTFPPQRPSLGTNLHSLFQRQYTTSTQAAALTAHTGALLQRPSLHD
jgi:hypothetical protein